ncbi:non-ribosomal peptide synthetase [Rhodococcus sp. 1168]|uniref:non-ribosomal peptide synthetase n=1 Tax=Rhodococcus sp. 1168 TaxID=2018041 RepID=UPI000A0B5C2E|nr:non-ribosomal peptide synthetase [Rhodococcus sp. 1168]ORI23160.1 hypothetical protein BJI47_08645 [Rhodococcus sp. 1168]
MSGDGQNSSASTTSPGTSRSKARPRRASRVRRPRIPLLPDILLAAVESDPSASALSSDGTDLSYAEVDAWSSRLARALIGRGLGADDVVAVAMTRSASSVRSVWGIAKSGATFLPVDPNYPADRIEHMLTDSGARFGVTLSEFVDALPTTVDWLVLDDQAFVAELVGNDDSPVLAADRVRPLHATHGCYMIYTSGSTGVPKGVVVTHAGLSDLAVELRELYSLTSSSRTLHFASPSFDASVFELLMAVTASSTMVIAPPSVYGGRELAELLRVERVTHAIITPAALASVDPDGLVDLETVISGGEACPPELVSRWTVDRPAGRRRFFNAYGPTEVTVMATCSDALAPGTSVSIGGPIRGVSAAVLDERLHPAVAGTKGELYLWGAALARGYYGRTSLTADRFVANPFATDGSRMYRTGDVVRWRKAADVLEYLGRSDFQVKIRGFRIELGEIDAALTAHSGVDFAVTVAREGVGGTAGAGADSGGGAGSTMLVSYVRGVEGVVLNATELTQFVAEGLPRHMVPTAIVLIDEIPLTPGGKLNRAALPDPVLIAREFRAPTNPVEETVARVFAEVLGVERVGLDDDFFALGGNSLIATQLVARLGAALDTQVPVRVMFEASTVEALAVRFEEHVGEGAQTALTRRERPNRIPLSFAQQRMWFFNQFDPESAAFNIPLAMRLSGDLDVSALQSALIDVINRHEALRTMFPDSDEGPSQVIVPVSALLLDLGPEWVVPEQAHARVFEFVGRGFDVAREVPLRVKLFQLGEHDFVLAFVVHHISGDGGSTAPMSRDIAVAYAARREGQEPGWSPLEVQYADYTLWQQEVLGSEGDPDSLISRQLRYWTEALADLPDLLELPTDRPRPPVQSSRGAAVTFTVAKDLADRIDQIARENNLTLFMVVHAALTVLLARLSGADDIPIGIQVAGRGEAALDDLVGMFGNTLILRNRVHSASSFAEILSGTREVGLAGFGNPDVPLERLLETLNPTRSTAYSALFQVLLVVHNFVQSEVSLPGLHIAPLETGVIGAKLDLEWHLTELFDAEGLRSGISGTITYATDLFEESTVAGFATKLVAIFEAVTRDATVAVGEIDLRSNAEREAMKLWNDTSVPVPDRTLSNLFGEQVRRTPGATAVVFEGESLTYADLDGRVNRLARRLIAEGVGPESLVGLGMRRSLDLIVGIYAVLRAGGGYVPLDPDQPRERNDYVLNTASPVCVLSSTRDDFDASGHRVLNIDVLDLSEHSITEILESELVAPLRPENVAYVIFTSGSTGRPKGVAVSHRSVVNQMAWMRDRYGLGIEDSVLQKTPVTFDASVWELFYPLLVGARLVVAAPGGHRDPAYLVRMVEQWSVTILEFVPSMLALFLAAESALQLPASLRYLSVGGEAFPPELAARLGDRTDAVVDNTYGPTEATVTSTVYRVEPGSVGRVPIGTPIRNTQAFVFDSRLQMAPIGVAGELYLAGVQLARGYYGRVDLTAERFVANPFGEPGARLYRTGDLVRWNNNGDLEYLGRTDFQVKLRGLRIELGEIEAALVAQDSVAQAVAIVHDGDFGQQLVGYVVPKTGREVDTEAVRAAAGELLPRYMVPDVLMVLVALPIAASGKLDRKALPVPEFAVRGFRAPTNPVEETVARVFAEVLGVERVGLDDDFFALGGNSLIATQVVARLGAALDTRVPVRVMFEASTVEALSVRVEEHVGEGARTALTRRERPDRIPLSLAQQRMWFLNQFDPESAAYNIPFAVRLSGELDVVAWQESVRDVFARHEALRTVFPDSTEGPSQVIVPVSAVPVDLTPVPVAGEEELRSRAVALLTRGFDVTAAVPVRGALFRVSESEHVLAMVVHHICADGVSTGPLARDIVVAYASRRAGREPGWAPLEVQYADYTLWQREVLGSEDDPGSLLSQQIEYWSGALAGLPDVLALPTDRPRPAVRSGVGASVDFTVPSTTAQRLRSLARKQGATPFMVAHAALTVLLAKLSGTTDIAIGSPIAGRGEAALDDLVGMFVNTLVLRAEYEPGQSFTELVGRVRDTDLEAFARADVPFERLVENLNPTRSQAFSPLFQVVLAFQNFTRSGVDLPGLTIAPVEVEWEAVQFDLSVTLAERDGGEGGYVGVFSYAADIFDAASVQRIAERFVRLLESVAADPSAPVGDIDLLEVEERKQVLVDAKPAPLRVPTRTLPEIFAAGVAANLSGVALTSGGVEMSYSELDVRSNRLARLLISLGIGPEVFVALSFSRSIESVVAVWAVAKAGGGFVPVDPKLPVERIEYMLADSGVVIGLTSADTGSLPGLIDWLVIDSNEVRDSCGKYASAVVTESERTAPVALSNTAYMIYTSGSTGIPKGVVVTHSGLESFCGDARVELGLSATSRMLRYSSSSFDASVFEMIAGFSAGATMVVAPPEVIGGSELADLLREERVTHVITAPAALGTIDPAGLADLRAVVVGGDVCPPELVAKFAPVCRFFNSYGPTESTIVITITEALAPLHRVTIGTPIEGAGVVVLDSRLRPVSVGVVGELYLSGGGLARGYHARGALTSDRFVANPFAGLGERMYRTGDLVRWTTNGELDFVGRGDAQVQLRGLRIELGEIEATLSRCEGVAQAVAVLHRDPSLGEQLVGYVVTETDVALDPEILRARVGVSLPAYMVPSQVIVLDALPIAASGKLDRKALPVPEFVVREFRAPTSPVEETVARVFAKVLGVERVGLDDDFFALGGNSLIATQVVSQFRIELETTVPLQWMFSDPTVETLARRIEAGVAGAAEEGFGPVLAIRADRGQGAPLFCIHPMYGLAWCYAGLAQYLGSDRPIYGIQSPALSEDTELPRSVEELASRYVDEIRRLQPKGPYRLMGWSLGGVIAHAMAVELERVGESVCTLAMLDGHLDVGVDDFRTELREALAEVGIDVSGIENGNLSEGDADRLLRAIPSDLAVIDRDRLQRIFASAVRSVELISEYRPTKFSGDLLYFGATEHLPSEVGAAQRWAPYVGDIVEQSVSGSHSQMTSPQALSEIGPVLDSFL